MSSLTIQIPSSDFSGSDTQSTQSSHKSNHQSSTTSFSPKQPKVNLSSSPPPRALYTPRAYNRKKYQVALEHKITIRRLERGSCSLPAPCAVKQAEKLLRHGLATLSDSAIKKATSLKSRRKNVQSILVQGENEMLLSVADAELDTLKEHLNICGLEMEKEDMEAFQALQDRNAIDFKSISEEIQQVEVYVLACGLSLSMGSMGHGIPMEDLPPVHLPYDCDLGQLSGVDEPDSTDDDSDSNSSEPRGSPPDRCV
ncbi:hypothetical protein SERLA73DRAFT_69025 [Serpula lacrymans var. lacrymans S7.3]|uniref:Uncharacterized protein n=1 Tax=Serpula lacrymans var. lacrymans (strain S7.3) TaxID=936435 RepID=F8PGH7_SERL3|nr:hypothetical protein SERLA73DRAFT_69025 [Serpula lacrymans var. lacrymans S7.3]